MDGYFGNVKPVIEKLNEVHAHTKKQKKAMWVENDELFVDVKALGYYKKQLYTTANGRERYKTVFVRDISVNAKELEYKAPIKVIDNKIYVMDEFKLHHTSRNLSISTENNIKYKLNKTLFKYFQCDGTPIDYTTGFSYFSRGSYSNRHSVVFKECKGITTSDKVELLHINDDFNGKSFMIVDDKYIGVCYATVSMQHSSIHDEYIYIEDTKTYVLIYRKLNYLEQRREFIYSDVYNSTKENDYIKGKYNKEIEEYKKLYTNFKIGDFVKVLNRASNEYIYGYITNIAIDNTYITVETENKKTYDNNFLLIDNELTTEEFEQHYFEIKPVENKKMISTSLSRYNDVRDIISETKNYYYSDTKAKLKNSVYVLDNKDIKVSDKWNEIINNIEYHSDMKENMKFLVAKFNIDYNNFLSAMLTYFTEKPNNNTSLVDFFFDLYIPTYTN